MWSLVVFWILIIPLIITMLIVYFTGKKLFRLVYILGIFTYAMTVMYAIDAYSLSKNWIIGLLVVSSAVMVYVGTLFRRKHKKKKKSRQYIGSLACVAIILIITLLSGSGIGLIVTETALAEIPKDQIEQNQQISVYEVKISNKYFPRQYYLPRLEACFYDEQTRATTFASVRADVEESTFTGDKAVSLGLNEQQTVKYMLNAEIPRPVMKEEGEPKELQYDTLLLMKSEDSKGCYELTSKDIEDAIKIKIV